MEVQQNEGKKKSEEKKKRRNRQPIPGRSIKEWQAGISPDKSLKPEEKHAPVYKKTQFPLVKHFGKKRGKITEDE